MKNHLLVILFLIYSNTQANSLHAQIVSKKQFHEKLDSIFTLATKARGQGDYNLTKYYINQTHTLRVNQYSEISVEVINSYINKAIVEELLWEYDSAIYFLNSAEDIYSNLSKENQKNILSKIYPQFGSVYSASGDYYLAKEYYKKALKLLRKDYESRRKVRIIHGLAQVEYSLGNFQKSIDYYNQSIRYILPLENNTNLLSAYYNGLALAEAALGNLDKQIKYLLKALAILNERMDQSKMTIAVLKNNLGIAYLEVNDFSKAKHYFQSALIIHEKLGSRTSHLAQLYESIGRLAFKQKDYQQALSNYQQGLLITSPTAQLNSAIENPSTEEIEDKLTALTILKSKINCLEKLFDTTDSLTYLNGAIQSGLLTIDLVAFLQNSSQSYESKLQASKMEFGIFTSTLALIDKAYQATKDEKYSLLAFKVSEQSKSSVLMASLRELDARTIGEIPDSLLNKEKQLSKEITFYKYQLYEEKQNNEPDSIKISNWENYLFQAQHEHEGIIKLFENNFPKYYHLKYDRSVTSLKSAQKKLGRNEAILQYSLTDSVLYTFIISHNRFNYVSQKLDTNFNALLTRYLELFHRFDFSKQSFTEFTNFCWLSGSLYDFLLKPIEDLIPEGKLIIIPDGLLSYLPFETLISSMPDGIPPNHYRDLNYLLYQSNIAYSYSSTLYTESMDDKHKGRTRNLLAFAPEYDEARIDTLEEQIQLATRQQFRKNLFPIPGAIEEVNTIKELFPSEVYIGDKATEANFRQVVENYDILHLAMHTIIDNKNPLFSKLIFTQSKDSIYDGLLNTYEIFGLQLKSSMVVLSACNTSVGEYSRGEGVLSLARGFVYAGTPSLVMTLWEVEDKSGTLLMREFYKNILRGEDKAEALRLAKLAFIKNAKPENSHPFFWSSFVVLGNTQPLYLNRNLIYVFTGGLLILGLGLFWILRKRKK